MLKKQTLKFEQFKHKTTRTLGLKDNSIVVGHQQLVDSLHF